MARDKVDFSEYEYIDIYGPVLHAARQTQIDGESLPDKKGVADALALFTSIKIAEATSEVSTQSSLMAVKAVLRHALLNDSADRWAAAIERNIDKALTDIGISADKDRPR